jgi:hypothetical protein
MGKMKRVANLDPKKWANDSYLFVKVEGAWSAQAEEYLLLTDHEFKEAADRAEENSEDVPSHLGRGVFTRVNNMNKRAAADDYYIAFRARGPKGKEMNLMFTEEGMDRIRERVEANPEDIEENKESWLADLFD